MSSQGNSTPPDGAPGPVPGDGAGAPDPAREAARLAHELANLLDGGMRNLGLAMSSLRNTDTPAEPRPTDDITHRLDAANRAMQQMSTLVQRFMHRPRPLAELHRRDATLQSVIDEAVDMITPLAAGHAIDIGVFVSPFAARVPAGPVTPVILNALRNAVESIADLARHDVDHGRRHIEIAATVVGQRVELRIRDDGVGIDPAVIDDSGHIRAGVTTKPDGHGLGLGLAQDIARSLGGTLTLLPRHPHGAELVLMYPLRSVIVARH